jgi:hypothetical protein
VVKHKKKVYGDNILRMDGVNLLGDELINQTNWRLVFCILQMIQNQHNDTPENEHTGNTLASEKSSISESTQQIHIQLQKISRNIPS